MLTCWTCHTCAKGNACNRKLTIGTGKKQRSWSNIVLFLKNNSSQLALSERTKPHWVWGYIRNMIVHTQWKFCKPTPAYNLYERPGGEGGWIHRAQQCDKRLAEFFLQSSKNGWILQSAAAVIYIYYYKQDNSVHKQRWKWTGAGKINVSWNWIPLTSCGTFVILTPCTPAAEHSQREAEHKAWWCLILI